MGNLTGVSNLTSRKSYNLYIKSFSTGLTVKFNAFVTDFSDQFKSSWNKQEIYGKMDPVSTFKNTQRVISFSFDVPSEDVNEALENAKKADSVIQGLYPIYKSDVAGEKDAKGTYILTSPPLVRVKFANLISSVNYVKTDPNNENAIVETGLLGYFDGFDFKPDFEQGVYINEEDNIIPKLFKASLTFNVIHEHPLGTRLVAGDVVLPRIIDTNRETSFAHLFSQTSVEKPDEAGDGNADSESSSVETTAGTKQAESVSLDSIQQNNEDELTGAK